MHSFLVRFARAIATVALCIGVFVAFPQSSKALNTNNYCSTGVDPTSTTDTGGSLSVNDVILWTGSVHTSSNCYGSFDPGNSSPATETAAINEVFGDIANPFVYLDKTGAVSGVGLNGIKFEVYTLGGGNGAPGLWTIVWTDTSGGSPAFPLKIDLAVLLVGGNQSAAYLLSGILVPFSPGIGFGSFDIQFPAGSSALTTWCREYDDYEDDDHYYGNKSYKSVSYKDDKNKNYDKKHHKKKHKKKHKDCKPNQPDLSHLLIAGRVTTQRVPEPATMAMFGAGLVGLWAFGRRFQQA